MRSLKSLRNLLYVKLFLTNSKIFLQDHLEFAFFVPHGGRWELKYWHQLQIIMFITEDMGFGQGCYKRCWDESSNRRCCCANGKVWLLLWGWAWAQDPQHGRQSITPLQATLRSACDGQRIVKSTLKALESIRTEECFDLFWSYLEKKRCALSVSSPSLPRRRKVPKQNEVGKSAPEHPPTARDHYQRICLRQTTLLQQLSKIDLSRKATRFSVNCRQFWLLKSPKNQTFRKWFNYTVLTWKKITSNHS